jgi:chromate transporter
MGPARVSPLVTIAANFAVLSLLTFGGVTAILPEVHRVTVDVHRWLTDAEFKELFAIAQAAPGPNMLIVTLIGWQAAGLAGALVATGALCAPCCVLTYFFLRVWRRFRGTRWQRAVEAGLAPLAVGLMLATGWLLTRSTPAAWGAHAVTAATTAVVLWTRLNPLWLLAAAGILGALGLV